MSLSPRLRCLQKRRALRWNRPTIGLHRALFTACLILLVPVALAHAAPVARITIGPVGPGNNINASTFGTGSFQIENQSTAGEMIESVRYEFAEAANPEISRTLLPDMVFDPAGSAGDTTAKPFSADSGAGETGFLNHSLDIPKGNGGFAGLELTFSDFAPGETFGFSIDVDPSSIQGVGAPGPGQSGSVSGFELAATRVIVGFNDGSSFTLEGETFPCQGSNPACGVGNVQASEVFVESGRPPAPTIEVLAQGATPTPVEDAIQTVRLRGTPGLSAVLLVAEGALFLDGVPGGGFDIDPFEANSAVSSSAVTEYTATLDGTGVADIAVTLHRENADEGGLNHLAAIQIDTAGRTSDVSNIEVLKLSPVAFSKSVLAGTSLSNPTTLQFGPDGRLYVGEQFGLIKVLTLQQNGPSDYSVIATETIDSVSLLPNHDDDGTPNPTITGRQVTGLLVTGTATNPVIYVGSSDPRIGAGPTGTDTHLDTNSGILTRLTWTGSSWEHVDLVRGLPRSEENHSINGLQLDPSTNTLYAVIGGFTNLGAPSNNFARVPEYALAAAILSIDLDAIGETPYDLPTLDDEDRGGSGQLPENDPFGGNNGKNQARLVAGGPVQVFSPGWRNAYDILITSTGRFYTVDNGANGGWGDVPEFEGPAGICTNALQEPGPFTPDNLHLITGPGYYGGHPNPTRANTANTFNPSNPQSPVPSGNAIECDFRAPGAGDGALATFPASTNGLAEYASGTFDNQMQGDLLMATFDNEILRVKLNGAGDATLFKEVLFSSVGVIPLDVTALGDGAAYPGTIWVADLIAGDIVVFEPDSSPGPVCTGANEPTLDEDLDGFDNADEIDNGTNPCSAADVPPDADGDWVSDLNDPDDDNDGQPDTSDPFALDPDDGATTTLPALFSWDNGAPPVGGILGLGFTGLMTNGSDNYADLFDRGNMAAGGAAGVTTVELIPPGDAQSNTQEYGFQFGFATGVAPFIASTLLAGPFNGQSPSGSESMGLFVGLGDQDHYAKVVVTPNGVQFASETAGVYSAGASASFAVPSTDAVEVQLLVDPEAGTVQPRYRVTTSGVTGALTHLGPALALPWVTSAPVLAAGILSTSMGGAPFPATWDFLNVVPDNGPLIRLNAGGPTVGALDGLGDWIADDAFINTGRSFAVSDPVTADATVSASVPLELFQSERWDDASAPELRYAFPSVPGTLYEVRLYFAEIYHGITGPGERVFDVAIDGVLMLDDFDIVDEVGPDIGTQRSFLVQATGDTLPVDFFHGVENPKLSAIEIFSSSPGSGGNTAPTLAPPGDQSDVVGTPVSLALVASDPDPDVLSFAASQLPTGLSIDANTGVISGTPTAVQTRSVTVSVDDGVNPAVAQSFAWTITAPGNTPPTLGNPGDQQHNVGDLVSLALVANDPDPDVLTFGATNLPGGLSIDPGTGIISGSPTTTQTNAVVVSVSDGVHAEVTQAFTWTIRQGNSPPQLTNPGPQSHPVGSPLSLTVMATDPDPDLLTFGATGLPTGLSIDTLGGVISGTPTTPGSGTVVVRVDDGVHPPVEASFPWTIVDPGATTLLYRVNAGGPTLPAADGLGDWSADAGFVNTGSAFQSAEPVTPDSTVPAGVPPALFQTERWDPGAAPEMLWTFPVVAGGTYEVRLYFAEIFNGVTAPGVRLFDVSIDGALVLDAFDVFDEVGPDVGTLRSAVVQASASTLVVDFTHVAQHPKVSGFEILALGNPNLPPTLANPGDQSHEVGEAVSLALSATDPEMDSLEYGAFNLPDGLSIDGESGIISGTPSGAEIRSVTISADDGNNPPVTQSLLWTITVPGNPPPALSNPGDQNTVVGAPVSLQIVATDSEPLVYAAMNLPDGLDINPSTGLITGAPTEAGTPTVLVSVDDGQNPPVAASFVWIVVDPSASAVIARVNGGGPLVVATDGGPDWLADSGFVNPGAFYTSPDSVSPDASVPPGTPLTLFQSERWDRPAAPDMSWTVAVDAGTQYEVRLYFAEIWFPGGGSRIFDVSIDGSPFLVAFDIAAEVGADVGTMRSAVVTASSSTLVVDFAHVLQNPKISAIEIIELGSP